jgi:hypothetical protein
VSLTSKSLPAPISEWIWLLVSAIRNHKCCAGLKASVGTPSWRLHAGSDRHCVPRKALSSVLVWIWKMRLALRMAWIPTTPTGKILCDLTPFAAHAYLAFFIEFLIFGYGLRKIGFHGWSAGLASYIGRLFCIAFTDYARLQNSSAQSRGANSAAKAQEACDVSPYNPVLLPTRDTAPPQGSHIAQFALWARTNACSSTQLPPRTLGEHTTPIVISSTVTNTQAIPSKDTRREIAATNRHTSHRILSAQPNTSRSYTRTPGDNNKPSSPLARNLPATNATSQLLPLYADI